MPAHSRHRKPSSRLRADWGLVRRYGWPICLVPVLAVVIVPVLADPNLELYPGAVPPPVPTITSPAAGSPTAGDARDATACLANSSPQLILVSIARQHAWMCAGAREVYTTAVTTGAIGTGDGTPTGTWSIESKETDRYLTGPGYSDFVHYWMPFQGDFGLHDASWQTIPFGDPGYRSQGSHGCVHLPTPAMSWLYDWAQVGATVTIDN